MHVAVRTKCWFLAESVFWLIFIHHYEFFSNRNTNLWPAKFETSISVRTAWSAMKQWKITWICCRTCFSCMASTKLPKCMPKNLPEKHFIIGEHLNFSHSFVANIFRYKILLCSPNLFELYSTLSRLSLDSKLNQYKTLLNITQPGCIHADEICYLFRFVKTSVMRHHPYLSDFDKLSPVQSAAI